MNASSSLTTALKSEGSDPKIRKEKESVVLVSERHRNLNTSPLLFHFEPEPYASSLLRLKACHIEHIAIQGKDLYIFDDFFLEEERRALQLYSHQASFGRTSFASDESREKGEMPALSMNNKEKWEFFAKPPQPIKELYKFLGFLSAVLDADVSTLPWDLCDGKITASAVATNLVKESSKETMELGLHEDSSPEEGLPFTLPVLYSQTKEHHPHQFVNGEKGKPWLVSLMLYATEEKFIPSEYGMGTLFCHQDGTRAAVAASRPMRFVLFEADIIHGIEESKLPSDVKTWRISYVFKLVLNPRRPNQSLKSAFYELLKKDHPELR